jgi:hypothetical protein
MQEQMTGGMMNPMMGPSGPDVQQLYKAEKENLELVQHQFEFQNVEESVKKRFPMPKGLKKQEK